MEIDGKTIQAKDGATILETAIENHIYIPTLCYHPGIAPYGACRLCMVEISKDGRTRLVASCAYPVQDGLVVRTNTDKVRKIRRLILELLYPAVHDELLSKEYGVESPRFASGQTDCHLCGLCVRYCAEVTKKNAVYFQGRGIDRQVAVLPEFETECVYCGKCYTLCAGGWIVNHGGAWA